MILFVLFPHNTHCANSHFRLIVKDICAGPECVLVSLMRANQVESGTECSHPNFLWWGCYSPVTTAVLYCSLSWYLIYSNMTTHLKSANRRTTTSGFLELLKSFHSAIDVVPLWFYKKSYSTFGYLWLTKVHNVGELQQECDTTCRWGNSAQGLSLVWQAVVFSGGGKAWQSIFQQVWQRAR